MKNAVRCGVLLAVVGLAVVVGLAAVPAWAAELRTTGYLDSVFPHFQSNVSASDRDTTNLSDQHTIGRTRGRLYFNIIGSDDLRAVFGFELDAIWGNCPNRTDNDDNVGSACFNRNTDMPGNIETKWLYVDFRIPQLPIGNRMRLGGIPLYATPLHGQTVLHGDMGAGDLLLTFTDQVALHLYYAQFEEDSTASNDRFPGMPVANQFGEDYATGMTLRLKPIEGLDLHIPFVYGHLQLPSDSMTSQSGPGLASPNYFTNVTTESRFYAGFDSRYRWGNLSIEPTFMYLFGTRNFCAPGSMVRLVTGGPLVPCTSPVGSRTSTDFDAFFGNLNTAYNWGSWLFQGKLQYTSGNRANDDINNRGIGSRSSVMVYSHMDADGGPFFQEWFEIFGNSEVDGTSIDTFRRMGESGTIDRFGWQIVAGAAEYSLTDSLILEGAAGGFWSAKKTGCPAVLRVGSLSGRCGGANVAAVNQPGSGQPVYNFTGNSRYLGWEVAAGVRYTIMPGLTWTPRLAYADYGKGLDQNNRRAGNAWVLANRMIYTF
jgi:hypothetical protein